MAYRIIDTLINDRQKTLLLDKGKDLTCYRLHTNREYLDEKVWKSQNEVEHYSDAKIRRWVFGKVDPEKKKKNVLIVGETGTGKTTLINTMVNYMLGVKSEDKMWFEITEEEKTNQAKSQTSAITLYEIHIDDNPISLTIIDTPGYGATDGIEQDKQVAKHLLMLFTSYEDVQRISSVGLVVKASQNRLTESQNYIFDAVLSLFGKNLEENIVIFITHAHPCYPEDALNAIKEAQIPCAKGEDEPLFYLFNNDFAKKEKNKGKYKHTMKTQDMNWSMGETSMTEFFEFLNSIEEKSLRMTEDVLKQREALEACVINLQGRICLEEEEQKKLNDIKAIILANKEKLDNNENFEFEVDEVFKKKVIIKEEFKSCTELATHCTNCKENCHFPGCTWVSIDSLWRCRVMKKGRGGDYLCRVCTGNCSYTKHVKDGSMYIKAIRTVKKTAEKLKKEYEDKYGEGVDMKARIEENLLQSKAQQRMLVDEAYECIMKLQEIALKKDTQSIAVALEFLISRLNETGQNEKAGKLEEIKMRIPPGDTRIKAFYRSIVSLVKKM